MYFKGIPPNDRHFPPHSSCSVGCQLHLTGPALGFSHLEEHEKAAVRRRQPRGHVSNGDRRETEKDICVRMLEFYQDLVGFFYNSEEVLSFM